MGEHMPFCALHVTSILLIWQKHLILLLHERMLHYERVWDSAIPNLNNCGDLHSVLRLPATGKCLQCRQQHHIGRHSLQASSLNYSRWLTSTFAGQRWGECMNP
jgi:hypothetical protein